MNLETDIIQTNNYIKNHNVDVLKQVDPSYRLIAMAISALAMAIVQAARIMKDGN